MFLSRSDNMSAVSPGEPSRGGPGQHGLLQEATSLLTMGRSSPGWPEGLCTYQEYRNPVADFLSRHKTPHRASGGFTTRWWAGIWDRFRTGRSGPLCLRRVDSLSSLVSLGQRTPAPLGQDALAHEWPRVFALCLSPLYPLIWPTLQRVLQRGHKLLLVAPFWPGRTLVFHCCTSSAAALRGASPTGGISSHN